MELKDFISEAMSQIISGVKEAQAKLDNKSGMPRFYHIGHTGNELYDKVGEVDFEILVGVETNAKDSAGLKLNVLAINVGGKTESESTHSKANKIKFSIPICYTQRDPGR